MDICETVKTLIESPIKEAGYILDDVTYTKEGKSSFLTVIIDKLGVVTVDDCVCVTNLINPILDSEDPIPDSYILDVCSKEKGCE